MSARTSTQRFQLAIGLSSIAAAVVFFFVSLGWGLIDALRYPLIGLMVLFGAEPLWNAVRRWRRRL